MVKLVADTIDDFFQQTLPRRATFKRIKQIFDQSNEYTDKRRQQFLQSFGQPMRDDFEALLKRPKLAEMTGGFSTKLLAAAAVDLQPDTQLLLQMGYIMQMGNAHMLILDEIIDNKFTAEPQQINFIPMAEACYMEFMLSLLAVTGNDPQCLHRLETYYNRIFEAIYTEEKLHVNHLQDYLAIDISKLTHKVEPIKLIFYPLLQATGKLPLEAQLNQLISDFARCFLLIDDFNDWREDLANRRYTLPLTLGLRRLGITTAEQIPHGDTDFVQDLEKALYVSEVLLEVYDQALISLRSALKSAKVILPSTAILIEERLQYLEGCAAKIIQAQNAVCGSCPQELGVAG